MTRTGAIVVAVFTVAIAMGASWLVVRKGMAAREPASPGVVGNDERVIELERELAQMRRQLQYLSARPTAPAATAASPPAIQAPVAQDPHDKPMTAEEMDLAREKGRQAVAEKFVRLSATMAQQQRDPAWADTAEKELRNVVQQLDKSRIKGATVLNSECKASMCRVEASYDNQGAQTQFSDKVRSTFFSGGEVRRYEENGQLRSTSYYYRQGYDRPL